MSMLLKSGMSINLATGQVFLTQNVGNAPAGDTDEVTAAPTAETENSGDQPAGDNSEGENTEGQNTDSQNEGEAGTENSSEGEGEGAGDGTEGTEDGSNTPEEGSDQGAENDGSNVGTDEGAEGAMGDGADMGMDPSMMNGMYPGMDGQEGTTVKDPLLSNWFFVGGISAGTLVVSIILGILLAKKRIKKGIELYED